MEEEIFALAQVLMEVAPSEEERLENLCTVAVTDLTSRLKAGVTAEDCSPAFTLAAAWLALSFLSAGEGVHGVDALSAGEISLQRENSTALERSQGLRRKSDLLMTPYLTDCDFCFMGVKG